MVGARRRDLRARSAASRAPCSSTSGGARCSWSRCRSRSSRSCWRSCFVPEPRERDDRAGRQPRRRRCRSCSWSALILAINFAPVPNETTLVVGLAAIVDRRPASRSSSGSAARANPLYDLDVARAAIFWVAACGGHHRVRLADGRDVHRPAVPAERARLLDARGRRRDPAGGGVHGARRAALGQARRGARRAIHAARPATSSASSASSRCWCCGRRASPTGRSGSATRSSAIGVGFAGTPASHSLTGSVPVTRAGMASGTADLQRDLGGAIMQSIFGALLTAGYAAAIATAIAASPNSEQVSDQRRRPQLTKSFASAAATAAAVSAVLEPDHRRGEAVVPRRRTNGPTRPGIVAILSGAALVFFMFPKHDDEERLLAALPRRGHRCPRRSRLRGGRLPAARRSAARRRPLRRPSRCGPRQDRR